MDRWAPAVSGVELKTGGRGVFEVEVDDEKVFSKALLDRFPAEGEIASLLTQKLGPPKKWRPSHNK